MEQKSAKLMKIKEYFINPEVQSEAFGYCVNQVICSLDYRNISCSTK